jgi:NADH dehydrogenase
MSEVLDREADHGSAHSDTSDKTTASGASPGKETLHRVVVVGGGAAGLELVTRLGDRLGRRGRASVTLIECARTHLWKPLLHAVAAGGIDAGEYELNYAAPSARHASLHSACSLSRCRRGLHFSRWYWALLPA